MNNRNPHMSDDTGYLGVILGPMFSGKTSRLISIFKHNQIAEIPTLVVNWYEDERYTTSGLSTHDGIIIPCTKLHHLKDIYKYFKLQKEEPKVILINEGQFFNDLYSVVKELLFNHNKIIYVCGLDGDYKMEKFGQILDIIPLANSVTKLSAICKICKVEAHFTKRISKEISQKKIGGSDSYIPVCRKCYIKSI